MPSKSQTLAPCCCGSTALKELKPYGIESVQRQDCHLIQETPGQR